VNRQSEMAMASFIPTCCLFLLQKCSRGKEKRAGNNVELFVDFFGRISQCCRGAEKEAGSGANCKLYQLICCCCCIPQHGEEEKRQVRMSCTNFFHCQCGGGGSKEAGNDGNGEL